MFLLNYPCILVEKREILILLNLLNDTKKLVEYFTKRPRIGTLSTANNEGKVNTAVFGTPWMIDEKTVLMGLGKNRTFVNLQENSHAVFMIMAPGETAADWNGVRVYLLRTDCQTSGERVKEVKADVTKRLGENAAKIIHAAVTFEVQDIRPVADFGQGWEKSI